MLFIKLMKIIFTTNGNFFSIRFNYCSTKRLFYHAFSISSLYIKYVQYRKVHWAFNFKLHCIFYCLQTGRDSKVLYYVHIASTTAFYTHPALSLRVQQFFAIAKKLRKSILYTVWYGITGGGGGGGGTPQHNKLISFILLKISWEPKTGFKNELIITTYVKKKINFKAKNLIYVLFCDHF